MSIFDNLIAIGQSALFVILFGVVLFVTFYMSYIIIPVLLLSLVGIIAYTSFKS